MFEKEPLVVYWAPFSAHDIADIGEWNMLYEDPVSLFSELFPKKTEESKNKSYLSCPSVSSRLKSTFVFKNNLSTGIEYDFTDGKDEMYLHAEEQVAVRKERESSLTCGPTLVYAMKYFFFAEEPTQAFFNPPFYHKPGYMRYGSILPGVLDIGQYFRQFNCEIQMWENKGSFVMKEGDPIFYLEIPTDRKIILKRFVLTKKLYSYAMSTAESPSWYGKNLPLAKRYQRFMKTRTNELVLREIKNNLL